MQFTLVFCLLGRRGGGRTNNQIRCLQSHVQLWPLALEPSSIASWCGMESLQQALSVLADSAVAAEGARARRHSGSQDGRRPGRGGEGSRKRRLIQEDVDARPCLEEGRGPGLRDRIKKRRSIPKKNKKRVDRRFKLHSSFLNSNGRARTADHLITAPGEKPARVSGRGRWKKWTNSAILRAGFGAEASAQSRHCASNRWRWSWEFRRVKICGIIMRDGSPGCLLGRAEIFGCPTTAAVLHSKYHVGRDHIRFEMGKGWACCYAQHSLLSCSGLHTGWETRTGDFPLFMGLVFVSSM